MKISLFTKKTVYENTFIWDFPEPEPKKCNCFGSGSGQKGRLRAAPAPQHWLSGIYILPGAHDKAWEGNPHKNRGKYYILIGIIFKKGTVECSRGFGKNFSPVLP